MFAFFFKLSSLVALLGLPSALAQQCTCSGCNQGTTIGPGTTMASAYQVPKTCPSGHGILVSSANFRSMNYLDADPDEFSVLCTDGPNNFGGGFTSLSTVNAEGTLESVSCANFPGPVIPADSSEQFINVLYFLIRCNNVIQDCDVQYSIDWTCFDPYDRNFDPYNPNPTSPPSPPFDDSSGSGSEGMFGEMTSGWDVELIGMVAGGIIVFVLFVWWFYAFCIYKKKPRPQVVGGGGGVGVEINQVGGGGGMNAAQAIASPQPVGGGHIIVQCPTCGQQCQAQQGALMACPFCRGQFQIAQV